MRYAAVFVIKVDGHLGAGGNCNRTLVKSHVLGNQIDSDRLADRRGGSRHRRRGSRYRRGGGGERGLGGGGRRG